MGSLSDRPPLRSVSLGLALLETAPSDRLYRLAPPPFGPDSLTRPLRVAPFRSAPSTGPPSPRPLGLSRSDQSTRISPCVSAPRIDPFGSVPLDQATQIGSLCQALSSRPTWIGPLGPAPRISPLSSALSGKPRRIGLFPFGPPGSAHSTRSPPISSGPSALLPRFVPPLGSDPLVSTS